MNILDCLCKSSLLPTCNMQTGRPMASIHGSLISISIVNRLRRRIFAVTTSIFSHLIWLCGSLRLAEIDWVSRSACRVPFAKGI